MKREILIIGAGAVGLVYGKHFADAEHAVTFLVKEKHLAKLEKGTILYNLRKDRQLNAPITFSKYHLISNFEEVGQKKWDEIYLCFSSVALQNFDFEGFKQYLQQTSTIILLQSGFRDAAVLQKHFDETQIVKGMITMISYYTPLPSEKTLLPGVAYWIPPLLTTPFSGSTERVKAIVQTFKESKIAAASTQNVQIQALYPSAFLGTFLTVLEANDWKFDKLKKNTTALTALKHAVAELFGILEQNFQIKIPLIFKVIPQPFVVKLLLWLAPKVMPMDIETYLEAHFTKVNAQTQLYMQHYLELAKDKRLEHKHLAQIVAANWKEITVQEPSH